MGIKNDYTINYINSFETHEWLLKKHYARRIPSISFAFGLYDKDKKMVGICTLYCPPSRALCIGICGVEYESWVLELNRLCLEINMPNLASYFVSHCFSLLPKPKIIVSYSDTNQNHHGYIYQALNFIYTGLSAKRTERFDINNPNKHSKSVTQNNKDYFSLAVRERSRKHRYIYFLGSKKQIKEMKSKLKYPIYPYPKGDNVRYDASYNPTTQGVLF